MADIQISVGAGTQTRLLTAGKYCADDILVAAGQGVQNNNFTDVLNGTTTDFYDNAATNLVANAFFRNGVVKSVSLKNVVTGGQAAFQYAAASKIYLPKIQSVETYFAYASSSVEWVYFGAVESIRAYAFSVCSALSAVVLTGDQVATLASTNVFSSSGISDGTGYVYVQDNLVEQYKVATNWVTYAGQIKGLSEIPADVQAWIDQRGGAG